MNTKQIMEHKPRNLLRFNVDLTDHCNLNCNGCGHFSPIANEKYLDPISFEKDCKRLSELTNGKVKRIELMGGEPLLHPKLIDIICIARKYFEGKITIMTNGVLLLKQSDIFWTTCRNNKIDIDMTVYPINIDVENIKKKAEQFNVLFMLIGEDIDKPRLWYHNKRDLNGSQNYIENFSTCKWANNCIYLKDGKLSTCVLPLTVNHFNDFFGETFNVVKEDSIDIYEAESIQQILSFLSKPIKFCRYCLPNSDKLSKWEISKKSKAEWI